jgi:hypothetical protein
MRHLAGFSGGLRCRKSAGCSVSAGSTGIPVNKQSSFSYKKCHFELQIKRVMVTG